MIYHYLHALPFMVSLLWLIIFLLRRKSYSKGQRAFRPLAIACCMYYFCYDYYFSFGSSRLLGVFLAMTGLSIEPWYYYGVRKITLNEKRTPLVFWLLWLPSLIFPLIYLITGSQMSVFAMRLFYLPMTIYIYYKMITLTYRFEKQIRNSYADEGEKNTLPIKISLVVMTLTLIVNLALRVIGMEDIDETLLNFVLLYYGIALFIIFFIAGTYKFDAEIMEEELGEEPVVAIPQAALTENVGSIYDDLAARLEQMMNEQKLYLQNDLKIIDLARELGTNRTYVSRCINQQYGVSFSNYINQLRIQHAESLLEGIENPDLESIALKVGFSNKPAFLRVYQVIKGEAFKG